MFFKNLIVLPSLLCLTTMASNQFSAYATGGDLNFIEIDRSDSTLDIVPTASDTLDRIATHFGLGFYINLGLGNQDKLTKRNASIQTEIKTGSLYWSPSIEFRLSYSSLILGAFGSLVSPFPWEKKDGEYDHTEWITDKGLIIRMRVLPWTNKINFIPNLGYRWLKETALIFDPKGMKPDLFTLRYSSNGPLYGMEFHYSLRKKGFGDQRLILSYTYSNLIYNNVNIFRISWGIFNFPNTARDKLRFGTSTLLFASFGLEFITGSDGRSGWFLTASVGIHGQERKDVKTKSR